MSLRNKAKPRVENKGGTPSPRRPCGVATRAGYFAKQSQFVLPGGRRAQATLREGRCAKQSQWDWLP